MLARGVNLCSLAVRGCAELLKILHVSAVYIGAARIKFGRYFADDMLGFTLLAQS